MNDVDYLEPDSMDLASSNLFSNLSLENDISDRLDLLADSIDRIYDSRNSYDLKEKLYRISQKISNIKLNHETDIVDLTEEAYLIRETISKHVDNTNISNVSKGVIK